MIYGRPLEFDPVIALQAAMQLFWCKGYESCSVQDLVSTMGVSKSSFYQTFKSKHILFQRCIVNYQHMLTDVMRNDLEKSQSAKNYIKTLFFDVVNETTGVNARRGCLTMNTASEFAQTDPKIAELVSNSIENFTDIFELAVKQAQQQGEIPTDKDARNLAAYLVSSMSGLKNMVKAGADRESVKRIVNIILLALS